MTCGLHEHTGADAGSFTMEVFMNARLNARHRKTLDAIFNDPVLGTIKWRDIEAMLRALGAEVAEGRGSRVRVMFGSETAVFHRPHPKPETDKGAVKAVRRFLIQAGVAS
jgi:hypothetical protein